MEQLFILFIKDNIQPQAYKTWFEPIIPVKLTDDVLSIPGSK